MPQYYLDVIRSCHCPGLDGVKGMVGVGLESFDTGDIHGRRFYSNLDRQQG